MPLVFSSQAGVWTPWPAGGFRFVAWVVSHRLRNGFSAWPAAPDGPAAPVKGPAEHAAKPQAVPFVHHPVPLRALRPVANRTNRQFRQRETQRQRRIAHQDRFAENTAPTGLKPDEMSRPALSPVQATGCGRL